MHDDYITTCPTGKDGLMDAKKLGRDDVPSITMTYIGNSKRLTEKVGELTKRQTRPRDILSEDKTEMRLATNRIADQRNLICGQRSYDNGILAYPDTVTNKNLELHIEEVGEDRDLVNIRFTSG